MQLFNNRSELKPLRRDLRKQQTEPERIFWNIIRGNRINNLKFRRQYSVGRYILDFYCPSIKLAIELDGGQHADTDNQLADFNRTKYLNEFGIKVVRFWNNDILKNPTGVYEELLRIIETLS